MNRQVLTITALALALLGFAASLASMIDYVQVDPTFCAETGCATVRASAWAHPLGIPMPLFGLAFYAAMITLAFVPRPRLRRWLAIAGGVAALGLIALQAFVIDAWCKLCLVADPVTIVQALVVVAGAATLQFTARRAASVALGAAAIVGGLAMWTSAPDRAAEPPVSVVSAPDRVTIVEFVDFECPFCRQMQARLTEAIAAAPKPVAIVRKMVPLSMHPGAMPAALAWCCADAQGLGDRMAEALFDADPEELTSAGCEAIASRIGCDLERYRRDLAASAPARVAADLADARVAGVQSLPTLFVGSQRIVGAGDSVGDLVDALDRAALRVQ